jgi:hypothetical protein
MSTSRGETAMALHHHSQWVNAALGKGTSMSKVDVLETVAVHPTSAS